MKNNLQKLISMRLILLIGLMGILISSCTTSIVKKQQLCESQYPGFEQMVKCTKESYLTDNNSGLDDPRVKLYFLKGDQLVEKLKNKEITELDARTEWQSLYVQLQDRASAESAAATANYNASRIRQTYCVPVGTTTQCTTY